MMYSIPKKNRSIKKKRFFEGEFVKAVDDANEILLEENKCITKALEELKETDFHLKATELLNKYGAIDILLVLPQAKIIKREKSPLRLFDDPSLDNSN